ncbi:MAG: DUF1822 family protein [Symploca sp. SIO2G7]|nr:DUF1822 family protein [Symploca sp. SIO2G7]
MIYSTEDITIAIPLTKADRQKAKEFAQQQPTVEKQEQVERNTLAVLVMHYYLEMLEVPTDLQASYCWNPVGRLFADVADLYIPEARGRIECRPIQKGDQTCFIPQEVWQDRIGYVVVELDEAYREGTVLGFVPAVSTTMLGLSQLQPLDRLIEHIDEYPLVGEPFPVQLSQWLDNIFEAGWQTMEELFSNRVLRPIMPFAPISLGESQRTNSEDVKRLIEQLYVSQTDRNQSEAIATPDSDPKTALLHLLQTSQDQETRWKAAELLWEIEPDNPAAGIRRAKNLGMHLAGYSVALMIAILPKFNGRVAILLRMYPIGDQHFLPPGLQLIGLDDTGTPFFEAQARKKDNNIQFRFTADPGDCFSVRVALNDASVTENFVI